MKTCRNVANCAALTLLLLACTHGSGPSSPGTGGSTGGALGFGGTGPTPGSGGVSIIVGGAGGSGGTTAITDPHPFGDGTISNPTPATGTCGSAGAGKPMSVAAAQSAAVVSASSLLAVGTSDLSVLGTYADSRGTHALLAMSSNGSRIVAVSQESPKIARVWDTRTRAVVGTLEGHAKDITALDIDSTGATVAAGSGDGSIKVWNATGGTATRTLTPFGYRVDQIAIEAGYVAAIGFVYLRLFDPASDTPLVSDETAAAAVAFSAGGAALFVGAGGTSAIDVYDTATGKLAVSDSFTSPTATGHLLSLSGDIEKLLPTGTRSTVVIFHSFDDWAVDSLSLPVPDYRDPVAYEISTALDAFAYRSGGSIGIDTDGNLRTVAADGSAGKAVALPGLAGNRLAVAPGGSSLAQGTLEGPVRVIAAPGLTLSGTLTGNTSEIKAVTYNHAGNRVFAASDDGSLRVWDTQSKAELKSRQLGSVWALAVSPDDSQLAVGTVGASTSAAGQALLLDSTTLATLATFDIGTPNQLIVASRVNAVAFSADGSTLAVGGSYNASAQLWSVASGTRLWVSEQQSYAGAFVDLQFVGSQYILGSMALGSTAPAGNAFRLYDVGTGTPVSGYQLAEGSGTSPRNAFVVSGDLLVGGYEDGRLDVWHLPTGRLWFSVAKAHLQGVRDLALQADGSVLSTSPDGFLNCWVLPKP